MIKYLFGKSEVKPLAHIGSVYSFGGAEFVFQDEWNDPCLISDSERGDTALRRLSEALNSE